MYGIKITFRTTGCTKDWPITYNTYDVAQAMTNTIAGRPQVYRAVLHCHGRELFRVDSYQA